MRNIITLCCLISLAACEPDTTPSVIHHERAAEEQANYSVLPKDARFDLRLVQSFRDGQAYTNYRTVYILKDKKTGMEYVGISGIGISELGSHNSGKTSETDER